MKKRVLLSLFIHILLLAFTEHTPAASRCESLFTKIETPASRKSKLRQEIIRKNHKLNIADLIEDMRTSGRLIYKGNHPYQEGSEFLASNEYDWSKMPSNFGQKDLVIGFGTNAVWDLAVRSNAKNMVIADWSPLPLVTQHYFIAPLIKMAQTPAEFIFMISGIAPKHALGLSLDEAFEKVQEVNKLPKIKQAQYVEEFLAELGDNAAISNLELKFITTFLRPKLGDNQYSKGYGPFKSLEPEKAILSDFYHQRYHSKTSGVSDSSLSNREYFDRLKKYFESGHVFYGLTSITDSQFYETLTTNHDIGPKNRIAINATNIFDCGIYNGFTFKDFQEYLRVLPKNLHTQETIDIFRTTGLNSDHGYYKYTIGKGLALPQKDEVDSAALRRSEESPVDWHSDASYINGLQIKEKYGRVKTFFSEKWGTQVYQSNTAIPNGKGEIPLVDPNSKALVIFLHGSGMVKSSGGNFIHNMNALSNIGVASLSFDLPYHSNGPRDPRFNSADYFMEWIRSIVLEAKKAGVPVYLAGHSFGPDVVLEYATRYPKDLDGIIALSPVNLNKDLKKWYNDYTIKMEFMKKANKNEMGGLWAEDISNQFLWSKGLLPDPTIINPKLMIRFLSGTREEFLPAKLDENYKVISDNTYDISIPLKKMFRNAIVTIEPGTSHYIFEAVDKNGLNVVMRELILGINLDPFQVVKMAEAVTEEQMRYTASVQLSKKYAQDIIFKAWSDANYGPGNMPKLASKNRDVLAQQILDRYAADIKARDLKIYSEIINSQTKYPAFYEKYKDLILRLNPKKLDRSLFLPFMNMLALRPD